ncbi:ABC transporter permease [Saccharibacillus sp. CPCC 101409]|uniref:ABC transporter permease n=1 Tax=Saccharibacillus sp. CPCC 101409 TaxID=3058041 RepID=UPI002671483D|nr:ABC transporter permease [Saccharibacillus sp. CPCC 101409]MDO3411067.1 ABC transporter permease [Saccharibacillus sp. CPCC 101409]
MSGPGTGGNSREPERDRLTVKAGGPDAPANGRPAGGGLPPSRTEGGVPPEGARFASEKAAAANGLPWPPGTRTPMGDSDLLALRGKRRAAFLGRIVPYTPYIIQSGLAVTTMLLLILFAAWYTSLLQNMPDNLPIRWVLLILLFPLTAWSGFRTYLQPADTVFLLPMESKMNAYFAPAWRGGVIAKQLPAWLVLLVAWPIYIRALPGDHANLWASLLMLLGLKLLFAYGAWQEQRMVSARQADGFALLRWALAAAAIAAWFWLPLLPAALALVIGAALYALALRATARHRVPWERLIAAERAAAGRAMRMLGWFVDVPTQDPRIRRRRWLSGAGRRIPWKPSEAYRFLLTQSFIRGDLSGMVARLSVVGFVLILLSRTSWLGIALLLLFVFMLGVQLNGLRRVHSDSLWLALYPIPEDSRRRAGLHILIRVLAGAAVFMWLPFLLTLPSDPMLAAAALAAGLALSWLMRGSARRKWSKLEGDED